MNFEHIIGDLTEFPAGINVIAHCCNAQGVMGSGIARTIKEKFPSAFEEYRLEYEDNGNRLELGTYTIGFAPNDKLVANLVGQRYYGVDKRRYVDYEGLYCALEQLEQELRLDGRSFKVGFPYKMGCDRAGGSWEIVLAMIRTVFQNSPVKVAIVELRA